MRPMTWILLIVLLLNPTVVSATKREATTYATYDRCMSHSDGITAKMIDCAREDYPRQHAAMQRAYEAALRRLAPAQRRKLASRQRRWMADLPRLCDNDPEVREGGDGTIAVVSYNDCFLDRFIKRATWLRGRGREAK